MTAAFSLSCADRLDAGAPAPGRPGQASPQSGPSFADLLQHGQAAQGQATHGPSAKAAKSPTAQADAAPPDAGAGEHADKPAETITPETPGKPFNAAARPSARARERAPVFASATQDPQAPPSAEDPPRAADAARHAGDGHGGAEPHTALPIAELQEWMASLKPLHPLPMPTDHVAAPSAGDAGSLVSTAGAAAARSVPTSSEHGPADASPVLAPAALDPAVETALLRPAEVAAQPRPADGAAVLSPALDTAHPRPADGSTRPAPFATAGLQSPAELAGLFRPAESLAPPASGSMRGLHLQRGAADGDDTRHSGSSVAALHAAQAAELMPALAALASAERRPAAPDLPAVRDFVQGLVGGATGAVPRGPDAGAPAPITLPAALHAPDFAQVLGAQVSVLARDGVQRAELHLHPAEMGPITVHIRIDEQSARVDFHANAAATRELIERGLPELASALREQGLTLAGGGVFQQAPDPRGQADREAAFASSHPRHHLAAPVAAPVRAVTLPVPQGALDVYA